MARVEFVQKSLNPEAPEFIPNRSQITRLKLPSATFNNSHDYCSSRTPSVVSFQNPNYYNFNDQYHYCSTSTPPSPYLHNYTTNTLFPCTLSLYTNPSYPSQPHDCLVGMGPAKVDPEVVGKKGCSRRGKRGYNSNKSVWRRNGGRPGVLGRDDSQATFSNDKKHYCSTRSSSVDCSNYGRNPRPKQRHRVVAVQEDGGDTTVMIRNIPNRFTRDMLMDFLDDHCLVENQKAKQLIQSSDHAAGEAEPIIVYSAFDFLYLPMDFKTGANKGYAFVNFTDSRAAWKFYLSAHNLPWAVFQSNKIREIALARLQGKKKLEKHFESTNFSCGSKHDYLPVCFSPARDGSRKTVNQRTVGRCITPEAKSVSAAQLRLD